MKVIINIPLTQEITRQEIGQSWGHKQLAADLQPTIVPSTTANVCGKTSLPLVHKELIVDLPSAIDKTNNNHESDKAVVKGQGQKLYLSVETT